MHGTRTRCCLTLGLHAWGHYAVKQQLKLLRPNGSLCIVGLPVCDINIGVLDLVASQKQVRGRGRPLVRPLSHHVRACGCIHCAHAHMTHVT